MYATVLRRGLRVEPVHGDSSVRSASDPLHPHFLHDFIRQHTNKPQSALAQTNEKKRSRPAVMRLRRKPTLLSFSLTSRLTQLVQTSDTVSAACTESMILENSVTVRATKSIFEDIPGRRDAFTWMIIGSCGKCNLICET